MRFLLAVVCAAAQLRAEPNDVRPSPSPDLEQAAGVARVESGQVPPAWRLVERTIGEIFRPPLSIVSTGSAPRALAEQALSNAPEGPARTRNEAPPEPTRGAISLDEQVEATHLAARRPRHWRSVEIEARLDGEGRLQSARLILPSEDVRLDAAAVSAVTEALAHHPIAGPEGRYVARFRISAARSVTPFDVAPVTDPQTRSRPRGLVPKMRFHFDEVSGKIEAEKPFSQQLHTEVKLVSLTPARP